MTSIPASRSARATTLPPRSWPSRPGLATTTRMRPVELVTRVSRGKSGTVEEYAAMSGRDRPLDWRDPLLAGGTRLDVAVAGRDPARWPGYSPRSAVTAWRLERSIAAAWDFSTYGGSFGEDDATVLEAAAATAVAERLPLLTL